MNFWPFITERHHAEVVKQLELRHADVVEQLKLRLAEKATIISERDAELGHLRPLFTMMPTSAMPKFPPAKPTPDFKNPYDHLGNRVPGVPLPGEETEEEDTRNQVADNSGLRPRMIVKRANHAMASSYASEQKAGILQETFATIEKEAREAAEAKLLQEQQGPVEVVAEQKAG